MANIQTNDCSQVLRSSGASKTGVVIISLLVNRQGRPKRSIARGRGDETGRWHHGECTGLSIFTAGPTSTETSQEQYVHGKKSKEQPWDLLAVLPKTVRGEVAPGLWNRAKLEIAAQHPSMRNEGPRPSGKSDTHTRHSYNGTEPDLEVVWPSEGGGAGQ